MSWKIMLNSFFVIFFRDIFIAFYFLYNIHDFSSGIYMLYVKFILNYKYCYKYIYLIKNLVFENIWEPELKESCSRSWTISLRFICNKPEIVKDSESWIGKTKDIDAYGKKRSPSIDRQNTKNIVKNIIFFISYPTALYNPRALNYAKSK